jgi:two-component system chemotaxis sensor kinase CheA
MDKQQEAYREEAYELLAELEISLLELEEAPDDEDVIDQVFRAMHTIKGSSAMFGFEAIAAFTHEVETVFDLVRSGHMPVTKELVNLALKSRDQIKHMLNTPNVDSSANEEIIKQLKSLSSDPKISIHEADEDSILEGDTEASISEMDIDMDKGTAPDRSTENMPESDLDLDFGSKEDTTEKVSTDTAVSVTYRIRFRPNHNLLIQGTNPFQLINDIQELGDTTIVAQTNKIPDLFEIEPEHCYIHWDIILTTGQDLDYIRDIFIFIEDNCDIQIDIIDKDGDIEYRSDYKKLGEILIERKDISSDLLKQTLQKQRRLGEILVESQVADSGQVESALAEQNHIKHVREKRKQDTATSSIRVDALKLDTLVDLVGELVTVQASLSQKAFSSEDTELIGIAEQVERLTADLRDNTMSIRMLPISTTFSTFKRLVRDLSNELGKEVAMSTEGGKTELDKKVIERLNDPMVHIIRNCIDHGIETPDVREKSGKSRSGMISLIAVHSGANVLIKISDDGAGINPQKILSIALEKGIISPDTELSETETYNLLFAPGFSTAKTVSDISGRGVGMDVVKRSIEALRGTIEIESEIGVGTTITLKLPLTLAIIDGLLVEIGKEYYVLPLSAVEECVELTQADRDKSKGRNIAWVRDEIIPYIPLRDIFQIQSPPPPIEQVVIVEIDNALIGFVVDNIIGEHQTVIKSLGRVYRGAKEFSGATILADGSVALIMDVHRLSLLAETLERKKVER